MLCPDIEPPVLLRPIAQGKETDSFFSGQTGNGAAAAERIGKVLCGL